MIRVYHADGRSHADYHDACQVQVMEHGALGVFGLGPQSFDTPGVIYAPGAWLSSHWIEEGQDGWLRHDFGLRS